MFIVSKITDMSLSHICIFGHTLTTFDPNVSVIWDLSL